MKARLAMPQLTINLFGEGQTLLKMELTDDQTQKYIMIAAKLKTPLAKVLADPFFYHLLDDRKIKSVSDLNPITCYSGLLDTPKNQIEIWFGGRKIAKLKMGELDSSLLLFPLYEVKMETFETPGNGFYILSKEVGLIARFQSRVVDFNINKLEFDVLDVENVKLLQRLTYDGVILKPSSNETLVTYQTGYEIQ